MQCSSGRVRAGDAAGKSHPPDSVAATPCPYRRQFGRTAASPAIRCGAMSDDIPTLRRIIEQSRTIAVVGLSAEWHRPSNFVAKYLLSHGRRIVPVNPRYTEVLGQKCYPRLEEIPFAVDLVDVFRRSAEVPPIARSAVAIGAKVLWQQIGVVSAEADAIARAAGLDSVFDRCVKIEHARLFGGLHWVGVNTKVISAARPH
jgi:uncharacterized protein